MTGIQYALGRVHEGEDAMAGELLAVADRHRVEHEVHHVARDLAAWSGEHVRLVAEHAARHGLDLDAEVDRPAGVVRHAREAMSTLIGRRSGTGVLLLEDLRDLYLRASQNSLAWEMLAQVAQAEHERELLDLTGRCHPQVLRQIRWANTMLKTQSPQVLASL